MWETVPQPSCETFAHGGPNGFLDMFIKDAGAPAKQWKYTNAPDADARAVQAAYWALTWAKEQGKQADVAATVAKAAKMGDYLRYAMFDKYFKKIGNCVGAVHLPGGHRQGLRALPDVLVLRLGRRDRPGGRLVVADRLQPQPLRLPEPDGGLGADQRARAVRRDVADRAAPTGPPA